MIHVDQIMYLNEGFLYQTCSDDESEKKVVIKDFEEVEYLYKKSAELQSLMMSIKESVLKKYFPTHDRISFHDKVLVAIMEMDRRIVMTDEKSNQYKTFEGNTPRIEQV